VIYRQTMKNKRKSTTLNCKCNPYVIQQLRLCGALTLWIIALLIMFPKKPSVYERPAAKFITPSFDNLSEDDKLHATVYAAYLADLPEDHPDVLLHKALSDQELTDFMVHMGSIMSEEDRAKYRTKSYEAEIKELKGLAAIFISRMGESEFLALKNRVREQLLDKANSWPKQAQHTVIALMEYTADLHPNELSFLPTQSMMELLQTWKRMAAENKVKYWPQDLVNNQLNVNQTKSPHCHDLCQFIPMSHCRTLKYQI
jgi:hypothetical protein